MYFNRGLISQIYGINEISGTRYNIYLLKTHNLHLQPLLSTIDPPDNKTVYLPNRSGHRLNIRRLPAIRIPLDL